MTLQNGMRNVSMGFYHKTLWCGRRRLVIRGSCDARLYITLHYLILTETFISSAGWWITRPPSGECCCNTVRHLSAALRRHASAGPAARQVFWSFPLPSSFITRGVAWWHISTVRGCVILLKPRSPVERKQDTRKILCLYCLLNLACRGFEKSEVWGNFTVPHLDLIILHCVSSSEMKQL